MSPGMSCSVSFISKKPKSLIAKCDQKKKKFYAPLSVFLCQSSEHCNSLSASNSPGVIVIIVSWAGQAEVWKAL